ncbi:MAG: Maf family nucleotide pyrophosphatase [Paramuribaculum sp.]|nr:Maf family nucleotide pyrophosphatase [Paramuribaculum sp.]MDE7470338.1 Maf family nucleotide pyrophosphatase [Paramuribaculum sp.]
MFPENLSRYHVMLASGSPRRCELLGMLGIDFEIIKPENVVEIYPDDLPPENVAEYLARLKADACRSMCLPGDLVITADTTVVCDGKVLGKPDGPDAARRMLHDLSGRKHTVYTGVAVMTADRTDSLTSATEVTFTTLSNEEIDYYIDRYRPFDKAGAYGIQEWIGAIGVSRIDGSYYNVMGLPVHRLYKLLLTF